MEWEIKKGSEGCFFCNKEFCGEEVYYSALFDENNTLTRKDFCVTCWNREMVGEIFSFWKTKAPRKDKPVKKCVNVEILMDIFRKLDGTNDPEKQNLRYVIALYLIRKKLFQLKSVKRKDKGKILSLHYPKGDYYFEVFDPNLNENEIEFLTSEMNKLLNFDKEIHDSPEMAIKPGT